MSVYTQPFPSIIFSPADHGTFSKTAGQSQAYYNTWNWEWGTYDVSHLQILTCEVAVSTAGSVRPMLNETTKKQNYHTIMWINTVGAVLGQRRRRWTNTESTPSGHLQGNNVGPISAHRLRRWPNTAPTLGGCPAFTGLCPSEPNIIISRYKRVTSVTIHSDRYDHNNTTREKI